MRFSDDRRLFDDLRTTRCLRAETGSCLAPCDGLSSRAAYFSQLAAARELLDGKNVALVAELHQRLRTYAANQQYEQAARLKNLWKPLDRLSRRMQAAREPGVQNGVYSVRAQRRRVWMLIAGGVVQGSVAEPLSNRRRHEFVELLDRYSGGADPISTQHSRVAAQIVSLWFRQHPGERERVTSIQAARDFFACAKPK